MGALPNKRIESMTMEEMERHIANLERLAGSSMHPLMRNSLQEELHECRQRMRSMAATGNNDTNDFQQKKNTPS